MGYTKHVTHRVVTKKEMKKIDRLMIDLYGIELIQMMENAGSCIAENIKNAALRDQTIYCFAGSGSNGGGALSAARRLIGWGFDVRIVMTKPRAKLKPETEKQLRIIENILSPKHVFWDIKMLKIEKNSIIIDGIIGYSLKGKLTKSIQKIIKEINDSENIVFSVDNPSGLNVDTGKPNPNAIQADFTITLGAIKKGFLSLESKQFLGEISICDIGIPQQIWGLI